MKCISSLLAAALVTVSFAPAPTALAERALAAVSPAAATKSDQFKDLQGLAPEEKGKFDELIGDGVFNGVSADSFGLYDPMNRAQFAKVAAVIFKLKVDQSLTVSSFADVRSDDPANGYALPYIEALKKAGLTDGVDKEGKQYNPAGLVTRQELAAFFIRGLRWDATGVTPTADSTVDDWARSYVTLALENKLMNQMATGSFGGQVYSTRKMLVLAAYEAQKAAQTGAKPASGSTTKVSTALPAGITVLPTGIELSIDKSSVLSVGDTYYDAQGRILADGQPPVFGLKVTGPNNYEFTPSQIETLYSSGYIDVSATGGIELDSPAIGQSSVGQGKIVLKKVKAEGEASVNVKLTHINDAVSRYTTQVKSARVPASIEVNTKEMIVLAENDQPQSFIFTIKDQYGKVFNPPSASDSNKYRVDYKLERVAGKPSLQGAEGIFDAPWDELKNDPADPADPNKHVQHWQHPIEQGSDTNKFTFKSSPVPLGREGSAYKITASVSDTLTGAEIASAAGSLKVYNWADLDAKMTYEIDMNSTHFAAGKYLFEKKQLKSEKDVATLNEKFGYYGKEVNILAYYDNKRVDITKVRKDDANQPISVVQSIAASIENTMIGAPSINTSSIPVYKVYGVEPVDLVDLDVLFETPSGSRTLTKRQLSVVYEEPVTKAVAAKNTTLSFNLNTVYTIRKLDGTTEQIKGSDYLETHPYVWEFLKFSDNSGHDTKDESQFFRYFIQATDQFGYKYQSTSDNKLTDFIDNLDMLKVKIMIDTDNKYPPKWSVQDEALKDNIWIDDQYRLHYEPHARKSDGTFDYSKSNLRSFSIELVSPTLQRSWCSVTLNP